MFGLKEMYGKKREANGGIEFFTHGISIGKGGKWRKESWKDKLFHILSKTHPFNIGNIWKE